MRSMQTGLLSARKLAALAACSILGASTVALAQNEDSAVLEEDSTEQERAQGKFEGPFNPNQDSLIGPAAYTNPKVKRDVAAQAGDIRWRLTIISRLQLRDDLDFRPLDESSPQAVLDTDDRLTFGFTQLRAGVEYDVSDRATAVISVAHNGLWGGQVFGDLRTDNMFFMDKLYFDWTPVRSDAIDVKARFGRQYFEIGGARRDFFFRDVVDGLTLDVDLKAAGKLKILGVDIVGTQLRPDEVDFVTRQRSASSNVNFRGDTNTYRTGVVYENTTAIPGLEARAFGFYADVGSGNFCDSTGSDISYCGKLANFSDNDYNWMAGGRVGYFHRGDSLKVGGYGEFARSGGIDRKDTSTGLLDVTADGNAFGAGVLADIGLGNALELNLTGEFFRADGASYSSSNGVLFNHGFVSFKGNHIGGLAMDDTAGWHPSAYVGSYRGVENAPQEQERRGGTQTLHAQVGFGQVGAYRVNAGVWHLTDTGTSGLEEADIARVSQNLPFGYSQADLEAQQRLGKTLGVELDLGVTVQAADYISLYAQGAMFMPGDFYDRGITRSGGTALGRAPGQELQNMWAVVTGVTLDWF